MDRTLATIAALLLIGTSVASTASAGTVEGFIDAESPIQLNGSVTTNVADPTLWIRNPDLDEVAAPLLLHTDELTVTHKVLEFRSVQAENPVRNVTVEPPQDDTEIETYTVENATIEISALGPHSDVLIASGTEGALLATAGGANVDAAVQARPDGVLVRDGYREMYNMTTGDERPFSYKYERSRELVALAGAESTRLSGSAEAYVWDAHVLIRNRTDTIASYDTGAEIQSRYGGTVQEEHYEYVTFEIDGLEALLSTGAFRTQLMAPALRTHVDGAAKLVEPSGTLQAPDGLYTTTDRSAVRIAGEMNLTFTPASTGGTDSRITMGLTGQLSAISVPLVETDGSSISPATVAAAGAGGATVLGLAGWYLASAKGATLAVPLARRREEDNEEEQAATAPDPGDPGELLFDPDRFTLYHLVRSRVGLSAEECREMTGIEDTNEQLALLADHGLLDEMTEEPRRYCVPGTVGEARMDRIAFLRRPAAKRLAELLTVHGLTPEARLVERARATEGPLSPDRVPDLVHAFVDAGLAYREAGEEGYVVDPTDELFTCLERMGEAAVPKVS